MKMILTILISLVVGISASPVFAQGLKERINTVKAKQNQKTKTVAPKLSPKAKILQKLLYTKLNVNFEDVTVRDALNFLKTTLDITIITRYSDDAPGFGIDADTPISLELEDAVALDVLEMILEQCSDVETCTWQLRRSFLEVGTRERLSTVGAREVRVYPINDLLFEPPNFTNAPTQRLEDELAYGVPLFRGYGSGRGYGRGYYPYAPIRGHSGIINGQNSNSQSSDEQKEEHANELIDLIMLMIEPDMWENSGGTGASIAYRDGALIVNAPDFIHRQLSGYPNVPALVKSTPVDDEDED